MKRLLLATFLVILTPPMSAQNYLHLGGSLEIWKQVPTPVLDYLESHLATVSEVAKQTGVPIDFLLCVSGLETGWGRSELARQANNHFGIKNPYEQGPSYCCMHSDYFPEIGLVEEYTCFKRYDFPWESYFDYVNHLQSRGCYLRIEDVEQPTFEDWAQVMMECGYATDPDYDKKLSRIRDKYFFDQLIPKEYR